MPAPDSYEYAVIRLVPRIDRQEFINVGVIMFCLKQRFLHTELHLDEARIKALYHDIDLDLARATLEAYRRVCFGEPNAGPIAQLSPRDRFNWLTSPRSTIVQTSPVHTGLSDDVSATFVALVQRLVI